MRTTERLRGLGIFARNEFSLAALQAVWDASDHNARQAVQRLANAGLVEEVAEGRWWIHDLLREYAGDRLSDVPVEEQEATRLAHARYWHGWLDRFEKLTTEDSEALEANLPEVAFAATWLLEDWKRDPSWQPNWPSRSLLRMSGMLFPSGRWTEHGLSSRRGSRVAERSLLFAAPDGRILRLHGQPAEG